MSVKGFKKLLIFLDSEEQFSNDYLEITKLDVNVYLINEFNSDNVYHTNLKGLRSFYNNNDSFLDAFEGKIKKEYLKKKASIDNDLALENYHKKQEQAKLDRIKNKFQRAKELLNNIVNEVLEIKKEVESIKEILESININVPSPAPKKNKKLALPGQKIKLVKFHKIKTFKDLNIRLQA